MLVSLATTSAATSIGRWPICSKRVEPAELIALLSRTSRLD